MRRPLLIDTVSCAYVERIAMVVRSFDEPDRMDWNFAMRPTKSSATEVDMLARRSPGRKAIKSAIQMPLGGTSTAAFAGRVDELDTRELEDKI